MRRRTLLLALSLSPLAQASGGELTLLRAWPGLGRAPLAASADGRLLALTRVTRNRENITMYRTPPPRSTRLDALFQTMSANNNGAPVLGFTPDGRTLYSANTGVVKTDTRTGQILSNEVGSDGPGIAALAFAPEGKKYALSCVNTVNEYDLSLLDTATGQGLWRATPFPPTPAEREPANWIHALAFSPDGRWLVSGSGGGGIVVRDAADGKRLRHLSDPRGASTQAQRRGWAAHAGTVITLQFLSATRLLSASRDGELKLWELPGGRVLSRVRLPGRLSDLELVPEGRALVATSRGLVLIGTEKDQLYVRETLSQADPVTDLAVTAQAQVWAVTRGGTLQRWQLQSLRTSR